MITPRKIHDSRQCAICLAIRKMKQNAELVSLLHETESYEQKDFDKFLIANINAKIKFNKLRRKKPKVNISK